MIFQCSASEVSVDMVTSLLVSQLYFCVSATTTTTIFLFSNDDRVSTLWKMRRLTVDQSLLHVIFSHPPARPLINTLPPARPPIRQKKVVFCCCGRQHTARPKSKCALVSSALELERRSIQQRRFERAYDNDELDRLLRGQLLRPLPNSFLSFVDVFFL